MSDSVFKREIESLVAASDPKTPAQASLIRLCLYAGAGAAIRVYAEGLTPDTEPTPVPLSIVEMHREIEAFMARERETTT